MGHNFQRTAFRRDLRQQADYFANPAVKRTDTGGAHLLASLQLRAAVCRLPLTLGTTGT